MLKYIVNRNSQFRQVSLEPRIARSFVPDLLKNEALDYGNWLTPAQSTHFGQHAYAISRVESTLAENRGWGYPSSPISFPLTPNRGKKSCSGAAALRVSSQPTTARKRNTIQSGPERIPPCPKRKRPNIAAANLAGHKTDKRIDARCLTLLAENPMIVISGQKIASEIGVSRSSVWRWTQMLRALGVKVKGHPRNGYLQIERVPDVLSPSLLRRHNCAIPMLRQTHSPFLLKAGSTNAIAL